jgi:hypothetical protein
MSEHPRVNTASSMPGIPATARPERRAWISALAAGFFAWLSILVYGLVTGQLRMITAESGTLEIAQVVVWALAILSSIVIALAFNDRKTRWTTVLLGVFAVGAAAREFDTHIMLNPEVFGDLGVRYRIDWWLDSSVSWALKAAWAGVAVVVGSGLLSVAWLARGRPNFTRARPRLFILGLVFLGLGFVFDDLLRGKVRLDVAQALEESVEMIGAVFYLAAVLAPETWWRIPAKLEPHRGIQEIG